MTAMSDPRAAIEVFVFVANDGADVLGDFPRYVEGLRSDRDGLRSAELFQGTTANEWIYVARWVSGQAVARSAELGASSDGMTAWMAHVKEVKAFASGGEAAAH